ncbi:hypothetical protein SLE2022_357320 [Rubroshorea leprosula]
MHILLTTLNIVYVLTDARPEENENKTLQDTRKRKKWENDDYVCRGCILNGMSDSLFDTYVHESTAKELWAKLETRYMNEDATSKKFLVTRWNNYKMIDNKSVMEQFREIEKLLNSFKQYDMKMDESIVVSSIIDKLPHAWKDFKRTLKHKKEDMSLENLANSLRLEEQYRAENEKEQKVQVSDVHVLEEGTSSKPKKPFKKKEYSVKQNQKFKKQKGACFHCGKTGHFKRECYFLKKKNAPALSHEKFIAVIFEINLMEDDIAWWINSGATKHVCKDKSLFKTLKPEPEGNVLYVGNSAAVQVKGKGTVDLEFTSGKVLTLTDVHYVPDIRKNLVSASLLNKFGFKLVFEADKFILSKGGIFVGKGYACEGMFKMNINYNINNKGVVSAYILDSFNLWHHRLGHVNFKKMHEMSKLELIPTLPKNESQCKTCMLTKITRIPFPKIERVSKLLDLVHSDVCDMHSTLSIGGKKYYVTFIDDYSKFCYVYLLNTKDEAMEKFKVYKAKVELQSETFIKCLKTDRGGEYYDPSYFESTGIIHEITAPYTPQQNGVAERKNRVLTEMVNAMLSNSGLSPGFWGEALLTACHILNRVCHNPILIGAK